ncbi:MAG: carboxypeptidase-like regulatory domain-containing protein, partial [Pseudonocardiaceae bacterium]
PAPVALARPFGEPCVTGLVSAREGMPLPGAVLTLVDAEGRQVDHTTSADDGSYQLLAPSMGNYLVVCRARTGYHEPQASWVSIDDGPIQHDITFTTTTADSHS